MTMKTLAIMALAAGTFASTVATAKETGWITGRQFWQKSRQIDAMGYMPVRVQCRDSGARQLDLSSAYVNVQYEPNPEGLKWYWTGATNLHDDVKPLEDEGYKLVSHDSFTRAKTGLKIYCLIFHKR